jgi:hypothetical protein
VNVQTGESESCRNYEKMKILKRTRKECHYVGETVRMVVLDTKTVGPASWS